MRLVVATDAEHPELDDDGPALLAALRDEGLEPRVVAWGDRSVDWAGVDAVLLRCVWDYTGALDAFLRWGRRLRALVNPLDVVEWNAHKTYLRQLEECGIPTVETRWLRPGEPLVDALDADFVVKPAVSAGARDTFRFGAAELAAARAQVARLHDQGHTVMVQPYLRRIEERGETALFYFGGRFSHAVAKRALLTRDAPVDQFGPGFVEARTPSTSELELAEQVLDDLRSLGFDLPTYARVDLVPGDDGEPRLLELELIEPRLFLGTSEGSAARFARAVADALRASSA